MAGRQTETLRGFLSTLVREQPLSDERLIQGVAERRDDAALSALIQRHGNMVRRVCSRVLHDENDTDDVFQACFLVLMRKAGELQGAQTVGPWLHRVAFTLALKVRRSKDRRKRREVQVKPRQPQEPEAEISLREAQSLLDAELNALPDKYRLPLILYYLEGKRQEEVALQLKIAQTTVHDRLERGRELLRRKLSRRGMQLSTLLMLGALQADGAAAVSLRLLRATMRSALAYANGTVDSTAAVLAQGTIQAVAAAKAKLFGVLLAALLGTGLGTSWLCLRADKGEEPASGVKAPTLPEQKTLLDCFGDPLPPGALARMGTTRFRQNAGHIAFLEDGKSFVAGSGAHNPFVLPPRDGSIQVLDLASGQVLRRLESYPDGVAYLRFAAQSQLVAFRGGTKSPRVRFWDAGRGKEVLAIDSVPLGRGLVAAGPGGRFVVLASTSNGTFCLQDAATGEVRAEGTLDNKAASVTALAWSPDGKTLALGCSEGDVRNRQALVRLWDVAGCRELRKLRGPSNMVVHLEFSADGSTLAALCPDKQILTWDPASGAERLRCEGRYDGPFALSRNGNMLLSAVDHLATLVVRDLVTGKEIWRKSRGRGTVLRHGAAFSPDGKTLVVSAGSLIHRFDLVTGKEMTAAPVVRTVAVAPDGNTIASLGEDSSVRLWDVLTGKLLRSMEGHAGSVHCLAFSPDGKLLASGGHDGTVRLWDPATAKQRRVLQRGSPITGLVFGSDARTLISTDISPEGRCERTVCVWDVEGGDRPSRQLAPRRVGLWAAALNADAKLVADLVMESLADDKPYIQICQTATGTEVSRLEASGRVCFAADGRTLATADGRLRVWDAATGTCRHILADNRKAQIAYQTMSFAPDGRTLATADIFGHVCLWDPAVGAQLWDGQRLDRGEAVRSVSMLAFAPDGRMLATAEADGRVHLWETSTGQEVCQCSGHQARAEGVAFTGDGQRLLSWGDDGNVLVWDMTRHLPALLRKTAGPAGDQSFWQELASPSAATAYRAMAGLVANPAQAVALIRQRLLETPLSPDRLRRLLADLDQQDFTIRKRASAELERELERRDAAKVVAALRRAQTSAPSAEVRDRAGKLLAAGAAVRGPLRSSRAVAVLEYLDSVESRQVLAELSRSRQEESLAREAQAALARLGRRSP